MEIQRFNNGYSFILNNQHVGKCLIKSYDKTAEISFVTIYKKFRGQNLSSKFWDLLEKQLISDGINLVVLQAQELECDNKKYGKLELLYQSWGFKISGIERYSYDDTGEYLMRILPMEKYL